MQTYIEYIFPSVEFCSRVIVEYLLPWVMSTLGSLVPPGRGEVEHLPEELGVSSASLYNHSITARQIYSETRGDCSRRVEGVDLLMQMAIL